MDKKEIENIVRQVLLNTGSASGLCTEEDCPQKADGSSFSGRASGQGHCSLPKEEYASAKGGLIRPSMPLAAAVELIERIEAKAAEWNMRVVTAVSDASARPVAVHCMDGAYIGSFDVALNKTYTSIAFQMSTARLGALSRPGESLYGIQFTNEGRIVIFGGGEVLMRKGVIVGALGVSGGSAEQDTRLAAYGKSLFETL